MRLDLCAVRAGPALTGRVAEHPVEPGLPFGGAAVEVRLQRPGRSADRPPPVPLPAQPPIVAYTSPSTATPPVPRNSKGLPMLPPITDLRLLSAPFTHTSTLPHYIAPTSTNTYEPLEFLGDAYLEIIATRLIFDRYQQHNVGGGIQSRAWYRDQLLPCRRPGRAFPRET